MALTKQERTYRRLQDDFEFFMCQIWKQIGLPEPTRAQRCIARYLQHGPKRLQIQAFRGCGKSFIAGAFVLWTLFRDQEKKILIISASKTKADEQSLWIQRLITETPWLQHLKPDDDNARWSRVAFDVVCTPAQSPSVKSVGITGQLVGSRADIILLDDVEMPSNSMTEVLREKLLHLCTEAESILTPYITSRILYLGTPQSINSVYKKLANRGYKPLVWPSRVPEKLDAYLDDIAEELLADIESGVLKAGEPTDPVRFDDDELNERLAAMGRSVYALQFQLDTTLSDADRYPLRLRDLIVYSVNPQQAPDNLVWSNAREFKIDAPSVGLTGDYFYGPSAVQGEYTDYSDFICSVDTSGRGSNETVAAFLSTKNGFIFLHDMYASKEGYSDNVILNILRRCRKYKVKTLLIESNYGGGSITELFRKHIREQQLALAIEEETASAMKERRIIECLEPVLQAHKLVVNQDLIDADYRSTESYSAEEMLVYQLFYQLTHLTAERGSLRFDDRVDALAQGVKYLTEALSVSAFEQVKTRKQEEWNDLLESFLDDPLSATNHLALGFTLDQKRMARGYASGRSAPSVIGTIEKNRAF